MVLEEPIGGGVSETASEGSIECRGSEVAATVFKVQRQAQQYSVGWLILGDLIIESSIAASDGLWI